VVFDGLLMGGIYALIAVGFNLQYGVARVFNISHGEFIMLGAFLTWWFYTQHTVSPFLSLLITCPFLFFVGYILYRGLFQRIWRAAGSAEIYEANSLLASFGLVFILQNIALLIWGPEVKGYSYLTVPVRLGEVVFSTNRLLSLIFALAIGFVFYVFLSITRLGKAIRAAAQNPRVAGFMGVNIGQVLALCFALGVLMASFSGILLSMMFEIQPRMGLEYTIIAMIIVVLGGLGSMPGSFLGGFILGLVGSFVSYTQPGLSLVVYYLFFVGLLIFRPRGLWRK
jgi:branched-chain amino acid transport system permease protein